MYILQQPHITPKSAMRNKQGVFTFIVEKTANKHEIKKQIANQYKVGVDKVRTARYLGKKVTRYTRKKVIHGQKNHYKKAIITLQEGQTLDIYS